MRKGFATGPRKNDGIKRKFQKQGKAGSQSLDRVESHASNFPIHLFDHLTQCNRSRYDSYVLHTSVHLLAMLKKYYPTALPILNGCPQLLQLSMCCRITTIL